MDRATGYVGLFDPPGARSDCGTLLQTASLLFCQGCEVWWDLWECGLDCWFCGQPHRTVA